MAAAVKTSSMAAAANENGVYYIENERKKMAAKAMAKRKHQKSKK